MKRVLTFLAIMLLPLSVMAMTPVSDSTLSDVTGQSGVNINADLTMNIGIGTMAWGDRDGVSNITGWTTVAGAGYIGVTGFNITNLRIKARETDTFNGYTTSGLKPITIDVATGTKLGAATTFVRFGLGSLQITLNSLQFNVMAGSSAATLATTGQMLGQVTLGDMGIYFAPLSYVDIYAHSGCGVNFEFNIRIDRFQLNYVSWGDTDGLPAGNIGVGGVVWINTVGVAAGYAGLANLNVGVININGTVAIDVVSLTNTSLSVYASHGAVTVVHISFPAAAGFTLNVAGPITADVTLAQNAALSTQRRRTWRHLHLWSERSNRSEQLG